MHFNFPSIFKGIILLSLLAVGVVAQAETTVDDCSSCRQRKQNLCVTQCAAAPYEHQRRCRIDCINEYCSHRCANSTLNSSQELTCSQCLEEEFPQCKPMCKKGTIEEIDQCKKMCTTLRCDSICENSN